MSSVAIDFSNIIKEYGQLKALDGVSFEVKEGEIFGFIGRARANVKTDQALNVVFNSILPPLTFVSSIFYPLEVMPDAIKIIALANPLTYAADIARFGLFGMGGVTFPFALFLLPLLATISLVAAMRATNRISL